MPSTTELGLDANPNVNTTDTFYQSFKTMSDSKPSRNGTSEIIPSDINENIIKSGLSSPVEGPLADLEKNPIVSVNIGEDLDVLVKMERMNK
jgi:hypothetical protein